MADYSFDDKRIDMMMERYRQEIIRMQRARPPRMTETEERQEEKVLEAEFVENDNLPKEKTEEMNKTEENKEEVTEEEKADKENFQKEIAEDTLEEFSASGFDNVQQIENNEYLKKQEESIYKEETAQNTVTDKKEEPSFEKENISLKEDTAQVKDSIDIEKYEDAEKVFKEQQEDMPYVSDLEIPENKFEEPEEKRYVEFEEQKENIFARLYKKRSKERLFFSDKVLVSGRFDSYSVLPSFLNELRDKKVTASFSSFDKSLPDLQRGDKLLEIKFKGEKELCISFSSMPCFFADNLEDFEDFLNLRENNSDRGILWEFLTQHKNALDYILYNFSDMGTPSSYNISYYSPAFMANENGSLSAFRLLLKPKEKEKPFSSFAAMESGSMDRDYLKRDLIKRLSGSGRPEFEVLLLREKDFSKCCCDLLAPTLRWECEERMPVGEIIFEEQCKKDEYFSMDMLPSGVFLPKEHFYDLVRSVNSAHKDNLNLYINFNEDVFLNVPEGDFKKNGFDMASERIKNMNERESRRLKENIIESMENLSGETLEKALLILSDADMDFGRALMNMIEA